MAGKRNRRVKVVEYEAESATTDIITKDCSEEATRPLCAVSDSTVDAHTTGSTKPAANAARSTYPPIKTLEDPQMPKIFLRCMRKLQLTAPTPIQSLCWPVCLAARDAVVIAPTGAGKTLGYMLPAARVCLAHPTRPCTPSVLIVSPTRELAKQVHSACAVLQRVLCIRTCCVTGGVDRRAQLAELRATSGVGIVIGTPGRIFDLLSIENVQKTDKSLYVGLSLQGVKMLILDEFDKIVTMGVETELAAIRSGCTGNERSVQILMFSATVSSKAHGIVATWLDDPVEIHCKSATIATEQTSNWDSVKDSCTAIDTMEELSAPLQVAASIKQIIHVCAAHKKPAKLLKFICNVRSEEEKEGKRQRGRLLVFVNKIKTAKFVESTLKKNNYKCAAMSSILSQPERQRTLNEFRCGKNPILIATDVAGRGLDIRGLEYVINYDFPTQLQTYVHRVGRTGRQGASGYAYSFLGRHFGNIAPEIVALLESTEQWIDPNLKKLAAEHTAASTSEINRANNSSSLEYSVEGDHCAASGDGDDAEEIEHWTSDSEDHFDVPNTTVSDLNSDGNVSESLEVSSSKAVTRDIDDKTPSGSSNVHKMSTAGDVAQRGRPDKSLSHPAKRRRRRGRRNGAKREYTEEETRCWLAGKKAKG